MNRPPGHSLLPGKKIFKIREASMFLSLVIVEMEACAKRV